MKQNILFEDGDVMMSAGWWREWQDTLAAAISGCQDIASAVDRHRIGDGSDAEKLLDTINGQARNVRKLLEAMRVPF